MINIQPYIDKLDKLKEYINGCIDNYGAFMTINFEAIPSMPVEDIIRTFFETGIVFLKSGQETPISKISFEEWYLPFANELRIQEINKQINKEQLSIIITNHAYDRGKERIGLNNTALQKQAVKAYEQGVTHSETSGNLCKFIDKIFLSHKKANNIKILGEHIFLFQNNVLITVYQVPNSLKKSVHKVQKNKTNP